MNKILVFFLCFPLWLQAATNMLIYNEGNVQISSEIYQYDQVVAGLPIEGSVMITHDTKQTIDPSSFRLGDKRLNVKFVQSVPMSQQDHLVVTIYKFQLQGMKKGNHTLPPIKVKVGGKEYQAPPLMVQVQGNQS